MVFNQLLIVAAGLISVASANKQVMAISNTDSLFATTGFNLIYSYSLEATYGAHF